MSYFQTDGQGNYIGYHIEGGETFDDSGLPELTMETLTDAKVLYLCNNPVEWFAEHLEGRIYQAVLKITFCKIEGVQYLFKNYQNVAPFNDKPSGEEILKRTGVYLHYTLGDPVGELTEGFLIHPTKHVISIEKIN